MVPVTAVTIPLSIEEGVPVEEEHVTKGSTVTVGPLILTTTGEEEAASAAALTRDKRESAPVIRSSPITVPSNSKP